MAQAQGIYKQFVYKKQTGKGVPASGAGGQILRRESATLKMEKDTYNANEITSHQQYTGDTHGLGKVNGSLSGVLSPGTYSALIGSLMRAAFASVAASTGLTLTIAGTGPYTIGRSAGDFLVDGYKIGDVVRLSGANLTAGNTGKNLIVTGVVAATLTVMVANGSALTPEAGKTASVVTLVGKKTKVPLSGHLNDYYTFEEWFADITRSRVKTDVQVSKLDVTIPPNGNCTVALSFVGIDETTGAAQVLTSPAVETTTPILAGVNAFALVGGTRLLALTNFQISVDGQVQHGEGVIGSKRVGDLIKQDLKVSGSFSAIYEDDTLAAPFDNEVATSMVVLVFSDTTGTADFVSFSMPRVKVFSNDPDDGKKQIVRGYSFTAEINGAGGPALADDKTTLSIQDSQA